MINVSEAKLVDYVSLNEAEKKIVLKMRNHPEVRKWMYDNKEISLVEHISFIEDLESSKDRYYFVVKFQSQILGTINFTKVDKKNRVSEFGLYANPFETVHGVGRILEEVSIDYASRVLNLNKLMLEVFVDNRQVINLHKKYGFIETGKRSVNGKDVLKMEKVLSNEETSNDVTDQ
jgi:UDP-4-amino-4,6-dideoxy-N-acetyl-beta-L-altrosamine N-acetyltransferase